MSFEELLARMTDGVIDSGTHSGPAVYLIKHPASGKMYVGSTGNFYEREDNHRKELSRGRHGNQPLQAAFNADNSIWFWYLLVADADLACDYEQLILDRFKGTGVLFNIATDARAPGKGLIRSDETRKRMSESHVGKTHSEESRRKMSESLTGTVFTAERCMNISNALKSSDRVNRSAVVIEGVHYESASDAARTHCVTPATVLNRVKNPSERFSRWNYAEPQ